MKSPLPEIPPPDAKTSGSQEPPTWLSILCSIEMVSLILSTLFFVVFLRPNAMPELPRGAAQTIYAVTLALMAINLFFLWRGSNFARWIYWAFMLVGLLGVPEAMKQTYSLFPGPERVHFWLGSLFSLGFSIFLATPQAARHFTGKR